MIKNLWIYGLIGGTLALSTYCKKVDLKASNDSNLIIKAGFVCGWGTGEDSIEISSTTIRYVYYIPSKSQEPQISITRLVTASEWVEILECINDDDFEKLNYQSCNVCVDGCDEWIFVQDSKISHKVTFSKGLKIDTISKLQTKLAQLRDEFNN